MYWSKPIWQMKDDINAGKWKMYIVCPTSLSIDMGNISILEPSMLWAPLLFIINLQINIFMPSMCSLPIPEHYKQFIRSMRCAVLLCSNECPVREVAEWKSNSVEANLLYVAVQFNLNYYPFNLNPVNWRTSSNHSNQLVFNNKPISKFGRKNMKN